MKIDKTPPLPRFSGDTPRTSERTSDPTSGAGESTAANPAVVTHFNKAISDTSQDIDAARVAEVKEAIREGRLQIHPEQIADRLIASAKDLLQGEQ